ncbi:hypothetical protein DPMN_144061 [Dreissena polymorpha]|uniref:Uncharacterized protein n=1 Tax=Dreissena polymorpha TaxID=45954 RepID=A0A9D4GHK9_DREPO|nr:hypothetical protein DPMN_144061 [Dreissena polymorpha]
MDKVVQSGCQFEKTDRTTYTMTSQDCTRTSSNILPFQCYINVSGLSGTLSETTVENFFIKVCKYLPL